MSHKILIVNDDEITQRILRLYCIRKGYDIIEANSGSEAMRILENDIPDILIVDEFMPFKEVFSTAHRLSKESNKRNLPIVFLTSRAHMNGTQVTLGTKVHRVVNKPVSFETLARNIKELTETNLEA